MNCPLFNSKNFSNSSLQENQSIDSTFSGMKSFQNQTNEFQKDRRNNNENLKPLNLINLELFNPDKRDYKMFMTNSPDHRNENLNQRKISRRKICSFHLNSEIDFTFSNLELSQFKSKKKKDLHEGK